MRKIIISAVCLWLAYGSAAYAMPAAVTKNVPHANMVGSGTYSWMLWDAYTATLYAPRGVYNVNRPFALTLRYLTKLSGKDIAERSVKEIIDQGFSNRSKLESWGAQMEEIFPDVKNGTMLTGVRTGNGRTLFYDGRELIGEIDDPEFAKYFFGIWLGDKTDDMELTRKLRGNE